MFLSENYNIINLHRSKQIINAGRLKKSVGVRHLINWDLLNHVNPISLLCFSVIIYEFIL